MHQSTLIFLGLAAWYVVEVSAVLTVKPQICKETRTRKTFERKRVYTWRRTCSGLRKVWYYRCRYNIQTYKVNVCCPGYKSYPYCNVPICSPSCKNKGVCVDKNRCDCPSGWSGSTCNIEKCNWNTDCYPGTCLDNGLQCQCAAGFSENNCQKMKEGPEFRICEVSLENKQSRSSKAVCASANENKTEIYTNLRDFNYIKVNVEQSYRKLVDVPPYPLSKIIRYWKVGLIYTSYQIILRDTDGKQIFNDTKDCSQNANKKNPYETIPCVKQYRFTRGIRHRQKMDVILQGTTGGYKEIRKENVPSEYVTKLINGESANRMVTFKFDLEPPYHCSEDNSCCKRADSCGETTDSSSYTPMSTLNDVTNIPDVTLFFLGWSDRDSFLNEYRYNVYKMSLNGEGKLQEDEQSIISGKLSLFDNATESTFTLPAPGIYSVVGEVVDLATNIRYCRALVLYADESMTLVQSDEPMTVEGSINTINRTYWLNIIKPHITIGWSNIFSNPGLANKQWLNPIKQLSHNDVIDYTSGNLSLGGTNNRNGTTKFQYQVIETVKGQGSNNPPSDWKDLPGENVADNVTLMGRNSGNSFTFWIKAEDPFGNTKTDFVFVRTDTSPPSVSNGVFQKNVTGPRRGYFSSVNLTVVDSESGVFQIDYSVYDVSGSPRKLIGEGSQPGIMEDRDQCIQKGTCICTDVQCFARIQNVFINNCMFVEFMNVNARFELEVINMALKRTSAKLDIGPTGQLSGINEYPSPYGFRVKRSYGTGAKLTWFLPEACYPIEFIYINLKEDSSAKVKLSKGETETELPRLTPNTIYHANIYIVYENRKESNRVDLEFNTGDALEPQGLSMGAIVGIVIAVLLLVAIVVIVIMIVVRVKVQNQPAVPQRITDFGQTVRHRFSKLYGSRDDWSQGANIESGNNLNGTLNVAYNSGAKLKDFEDDIYAYGEMDTDPEANWKHSNDRLHPGRTIHVGKFAEILKGTLSNQEGTRIVAIKRLKEHNEDNELLMKAKMNFLATSVPHHNNIVNFVGAVTEGPLILLEYCEQSLKDWLKSIDNINDEIEDDMINFCTDIARGMQHLHTNQIIHRRLGIRNVLVKEIQMMGRKVAKVTGFGPMKGETAGDGGPERIPIKWMAPEQLGLGKSAKRPYTDMTDIWSYGITVWEIYTKGESPFAEHKHSEIKGLLERGIRPPRPQDCQEELYDDVMLKCWQQKPSKRPKFSEIRLTLEKLFNGAPNGEGYYDDQYMMYEDTKIHP